MKKIINLVIGFCVALCVPLVTYAVLNSAAVGTSPVNGLFLQTNGATSTWAAVSGGGGSSTVVTGIDPIILSTLINGHQTSSFNTSTALSLNALYTFLKGVSINGTTTIASTTNSLVLTNSSGTIIGYVGATCPANQAFIGLSATGTPSCSAFLVGNQLITLTGAVTGSGATSISTVYTTSTLYGLFSGTSPILFNTSTGVFSFSNSGVASGSYTNANITVSSSGLITAASNGTGSGGSISTSSAVTVFQFPYWANSTGGLSGTSTIFYSSSTGYIGIGAQPVAGTSTGIFTVDNFLHYAQNQFGLGEGNTFVGLFTPTSSNDQGDTFFGSFAGQEVATEPTGRVGNTAFGFATLAGLNSATTSIGSGNTAIGFEALGNSSNTTGFNTALGNAAGLSVTSGIKNTLLGDGAGRELTTGSDNIFIGELAGHNLPGGSPTSSSNLFVINDGTVSGDPILYGNLANLTLGVATMTQPSSKGLLIGGVLNVSGAVGVSSTLTQSGGVVSLASTSIAGAASTTGNLIVGGNITVGTSSSVFSGEYHGSYLQNATSSAATTTINLGLRNVQGIVLGTATTSIVFSNTYSGFRGVVPVFQDGTGSRTVTAWSAGTTTLIWSSGSAPTLQTTAKAHDDIGIFCYANPFNTASTTCDLAVNPYNTAQ